MDETSGIRPMRPVHADDVREPLTVKSPVRVVGRIGLLIVAWIAVFVAANVLALPESVIGAALVGIIIAVEVARWLLRRRQRLS
jgi:uncharacterized membrane protein